MENTIIVIDDDRDYLDIIKKGLNSAGFKNVRIEDNPLKVASVFEGGQEFDIALIDMNMPDMDGMELLEVIKHNSPNTECIMVTAVNEARIAVECLKKGVYHYLVKPVPHADLVLTIKRALEKKRLLDILDIEKKTARPQLKNPKPFKPIVTKSSSVLKVLKAAELHSGSDVPVLITGESGTGKELLARAIHAASPRSGFPFTPVNMASIAGSLFDAEFFGHAKGAFTGAEKNRSGYLEHTHQGTLFLDEIGNLPLEFQGKLLRALQDGEYIKIGTNTHQKADVRFIAATNEDLDKMIAKKKFRKDLYYRIRGGWLHLPPLRERAEDIPLLINTFLSEFPNHTGRSRIAEGAMALLMAYDYPGNIRELRSIIQAGVNLAQGKPISVNLLPAQIQKQRSFLKQSQQIEPGPLIPLAQVEKSYILKAYHHTGRNKSKTARTLGIGLNTLRRKLASYGVK